ncbi:hypothetical protein AT1219_20434 [Vibrio alginolyticus]
MKGGWLTSYAVHRELVEQGLFNSCFLYLKQLLEMCFYPP